MPDGAGGSPASKSGSQKSGGIMRQGMREINALKGRVCLVPPHWLSRPTPTSTRKVSAAVRYGALKLTAWWLCEDGMISDEGHGGQVASVCRAVTHARERERERERERGSRRQRARVHKGWRVGSNAQRVQRERAVCLAGQLLRTRAAKQQSSSLRRRGLDIP